MGSLKGSFQAGQRVTLINLKGITQKIAEAQAAMSGAETNIHRSGETIDDIQNGSNEMGSVIDYWERWDRKGVHDRAANIQFLATAVAMDKVRTAMLGESVDPVNLTNNTFPQVYIPRGMYWDPIFSWKKHSLEFSKNSNFVSAYSTRAWVVASIKSLSSLITGALLNVAKLIGYFTIILAQAKLERTASYSILNTIKSPWVGAQTKIFSAGAITDIALAFAVDKATLETKTIVTLAIIGILNILTAMLGVLISQIKSYEHVELMGNNPSQYLNAPIRRNVDREQWYTYAFIDQLVDASMSIASTILDKIAMTDITNEIKEVAQFFACAAALKIASITPDIPGETPKPNPVGVGAANLAASLMKKATADDSMQVVFLTISIVPAIASVVVNMTKAFTFITTRTNLDSNIPLNSNSISTSAGKPGKKYNSLNEIGNMDEIPIDNWTSSIAKMSGSLGAISMAGSQFSGAVAGAAGFAREATASAVIAGGPTRYDTYIMSDMNEQYRDWAGHSYDRVNTGRNLVCWSHVFNENLFGIKPSQIGGRKIEKTIVIKTKVLGNADSTIYCLQALCKCVGESNLHLLLERDALITKRKNNDQRILVTIMDEFNKNTGTHHEYELTGNVNYPVGYSYEDNNGIIKTVLWKGYAQFNSASYNKKEQIIWNFDPENTGDFFTGDRNGKYSEMFEIDSSSGTTTYYNLDGSFYDSKTNAGYTQRSYRPNMEWKYNKLMGEVINTEVTGYDKFMNIPSNYRDRSTSSGDITGYENIYR